MSKWLNHTQLDVCEKKKLPCFLYLIQIFALHCRRTPLHYYHRRLPLAAYVVLIGQSVTERKPAGYRTRPRRAIEVAAFGRRAARGSRLAAEFCFTTGFLLVCTATVYYCRHCACRRRKPPKQLAFFLSPIQHHVRGKLPLDKSTLYHRKSSWSHTNQNARNLKHTKERLYSRFIRGKKWASFYTSDCVELENLFQKYHKMYGANLPIKWMSLLISNQLHI